MIEKIVLDYLNESMSVPFYMEQPEKKPEEYGLIEKTGSWSRNKGSGATLAIQSYADSLLRAAEINEELKQAMEGILALDSISSAKLNSDYNYTDTSRKKYRYQAVYEVAYF